MCGVGKLLGEVEEGFVLIFICGDIFLIGGWIVWYEGLKELVVEVF